MQNWKNESEEVLEQKLKNLLAQIPDFDVRAARQAELRWDSVAKPLKSLGLLEEHIIKIAGMTGDAEIRIEKKALAVMCADNGIVKEHVTQTGQEVTAVVAANFTKGETCSCLMAEQAGAEVFPIDIGIACELKDTGFKYPLLKRKIRRGTEDFLEKPAMTRKETLAAVLTGIGLVKEWKEAGFQILATGEMGIGNTTTSSAVASVLLEEAAENVTGKGAGLSREGVKHKIDVIKKGIALHHPDRTDGIEVLSKVGGLDLAGLAGIFLGGAVYRIPVVIDGFISAAAAAAAKAVHPSVGDFMLASHVSAEPAGEKILSYLGVKPAIRAEMCLGEGTGALALFPLLDMAVRVYREMSTFKEIQIETYQPL